MKQKILKTLDALGIEYKNYEYDAVFICNAAKGIDFPGERMKTLLLRNKKPTQFYMVVLGYSKQLDSKQLRHILGENKISFANEERIVKKIGVRPGNVNPFANINDNEKDIIVIFDKALRDKLVGFHPGQNDNTVVLNSSGVEQYLKYLGVEYKYMEL